jgi:hypothetical protein
MKRYCLFLLLSLTIFASHLVNVDSPKRSDTHQVLAIGAEHHEACNSHPAFEQVHPHDEIRLNVNAFEFWQPVTVRMFHSYNQFLKSSYARFFWQPPKLA